MRGRLLTGLIATAIAAACIGTVCGARDLSISGDSSYGAATGTRTATIIDPILNMRAYTLTIPANWIFQGAVIQGTPCVPGPFPVWRMSSPDGLTGLKALPRLDWAFSDKPNSAPQPQANSACLPYKKEMPAAEVLRYMVGILQVEFVKDEPVPWLAASKKTAAEQSTPAATNTVDIAIATVRYHINSIEIQEQLKVFASCVALHGGSFDGKHYCSAMVTREWAPHGKWSADTFDPIAKSFVIDEEWSKQWNAEMTQKIKDQAEIGRRMIQKIGKDANGRMTAQKNAFDQAQDMRQQQHDQFLETLQRGADLSMKQAANSANANHRMAGDWADYSLDQQKRLDPNTGQITKDSSAYSYTWVNESGQRIQTNDINANPNGNGTGNWTLQLNIR